MNKKILSVLLSVIIILGVIAVIPVNAAETEMTASQEEIISTKLGDVDGNGKVDVKDVTCMQKYLSGEDVKFIETNSEVTGDDEYDITDALVIQKFVMHYMEEFPVTTDNDWRKNSIGYEIFVRSFYDSNNDGCGDFRGVAEKVDYLKSLNIGVVWLMPINKAASYHGYDVVDYKDVCADYGTIEDFEYMLKVLHDNGIRVILDLVVNHTSDTNPWFVKSAANNSDYRDFYVWDTAPKSHLNNWQKKNGSYYYHCFAWGMPDLNYRNKKVWYAIDDVADFWLDKGVDGFRLDAVMHIDDGIVQTNGHDAHTDNVEDTVNHEWWQHFQQHVKSKNKDAFCVGEVWSEVNMQDVQSRFFADLDSNFDFYMMSEIKTMSKGSKKSVARIAQNYQQSIMAAAETTPEIDKVTINSLMLDNHDTDRIAYLLTANKDQMKFAAAVEMTLPGMPWIYYGDELGQNGGGTDSSFDPNRREALDWYKARYGDGATRMHAVRHWGGTKQEAYTKANDGISVEEESGVQGSMLEYYRTLTSIRTKYKIFSTGDCIDGRYFGNAYGYRIVDDSRGYSMAVIHNNNNASTLTVKADFTDLLSGKSYKAGDSITIAKWQSLIIKINDGENHPLI